ncbi:hypothetical protein J2S49_000907 [Arcanobacterium wilhelmae]|uniref:Uncharacterized protein n=1 Tax=Arcanobacterium wilhelmae TaxID=1803177 RepID=A0ABT9NAW3_9ACTO|nr:hypothetical protein [Arcanobacterium wilhelmae]MDP9800831.1 hypothetical protein [Arcanobacterium wilhelmae]WFN90205.1 hypothetical protein P8A24_08475 [Arcanobacterium wilhelmae]
MATLLFFSFGISPAGAGGQGGSLSVRQEFKSAAEEYNPQRDESIVQLAELANELVLENSEAGESELPANSSPLNLGLGQSGTTMISPKGSDSVENSSGMAIHQMARGRLHLVERASESRGQIIAVMSDENSSFRHEYELKLPKYAEMEISGDGSIAITDRRSNSLLGMIDKPWGVDARGVDIPTHYELSGNLLTQVVITDEKTQFPVVADPSWTWWLKESAKCSGAVATLGLLGWAKTAISVAKLAKMMRAAKTNSALGRAYKVWLRMGKNDKARFAALYGGLKEIGKKVTSKGYQGIAEAQKNSRPRNVLIFVREASGAITAVFGLGSCVSLVRGK